MCGPPTTDELGGAWFPIPYEFSMVLGPGPEFHFWGPGPRFHMSSYVFWSPVIKNMLCSMCAKIGFYVIFDVDSNMIFNVAFI